METSGPTDTEQPDDDEIEDGDDGDCGRNETPTFGVEACDNTADAEVVDDVVSTPSLSSSPSQRRPGSDSAAASYDSLAACRTEILVTDILCIRLPIASLHIALYKCRYTACSG